MVKNNYNCNPIYFNNINKRERDRLDKYCHFFKPWINGAKRRTIYDRHGIVLCQWRNNICWRPLPYSMGNPHKNHWCKQWGGRLYCKMSAHTKLFDRLCQK